ncbi:MAG TPA: WecB/TagA/CpsF family glycosyltransferase, partial [Trueperaceae bacterium]
MPEGLAPPNCRVLGYSLARITLEEATAWCLAQVRQPSPKLLVTLNPEIVVRAAAEAELRAALLQADLTVADGVGILWAARQAGCRLPERVPGVDLATRLLERGGS